MDTKPEPLIIALLMSARDEEAYIDLNIRYHLDLGFDYLFIVDHCSTDKTAEIVAAYKDNRRVVILSESDPVFDHAKITNRILDYVNRNYTVDWFAFLDADEFLSVAGDDIHAFVMALAARGIPYATIGWANALFDETMKDYRCAPTHAIDTTKYYYPWAERTWQEYGHFRKAIVKNHPGVEVVVGGHYVKTENAKDFFGEFNWNPFIVPRSMARILHFEFRNRAELVLRKWKNLALFEHDSTSSPDAPWMERIRTIRGYAREFEHDLDAVRQRWFSEHRTFWGTLVPEDRVVYDTTLTRWYGRYFRDRIDSGSVRSVCLVRSGNLGDVIMTEAVAAFLSQYVPRVCLATDVVDVKDILPTYADVFQYNEIGSGMIDCDIVIRLAYELSDNQKTYIQAYMESIGFGDVQNSRRPRIKSEWRRMVDHKYILIAPYTSGWEEQKRNWGLVRFSELARSLEEMYQTPVVFLDTHYSFVEMMSLIAHCDFFIGNDSGPGVIAQSLNVLSFIIFGATQPRYLPMGERTVPIYDLNRHILCTHRTRLEEIECCEEFCMERIRPDVVLNIVKKHVWTDSNYR